MNNESRNRTVLGADCRIQGELWLDNDATILGRFEGQLHVMGELELGPQAQVRGKINTHQLKLAGRFEGDLIADESVQLLPGSAISGRLFTPKLLCGENALIQGQIHVGPGAMKRAGHLPALPADSSDRARNETHESTHDETHSSPALPAGDVPVAVLPTVTIPGNLKNVLQSRKTLKIIHAAGSPQTATATQDANAG